MSKLRRRRESMQRDGEALRACGVRHSQSRWCSGAGGSGFVVAGGVRARRPGAATLGGGHVGLGRKVGAGTESLRGMKYSLVGEVANSDRS